MLISHTKKFIFIHIYKTAGTSVMDVFLPYCRLIDRLVYENKISRKLIGISGHLLGWDDDGNKQFTGFHMHATAAEIREKMGGSLFDSYYKFVFVRNPFDFLVSLYFYISQDKNHRDHGMVLKMSFLVFLRWYTVNNPSHQVDFIVEPHTNKMLVDYIGRFETLEKDITFIQERLGLEVRKGVQHKNPSLKRKSKNYKDYYNDEAKNLVENYFQTDLNLLGYNFDGFQENSPMMHSY